MSDPPDKELARIRRAVRAVELRMRLDRALRVVPASLTFGLAVAAATLATRKVFPQVLAEGRARSILVATAALIVVAIVAALLRRLPARAGTVALDRHHGLADRLTNALAFEALAPAQRTPLMEAAIDDAYARARALRPSKAAPIHAPRDLAAPLLAAAGVALVAMLEVRTLLEEPQVKPLDGLTMSPDDLELFKDAAAELAKKEHTPEVKAAVERFNQLIEDLAQKRLDRTEAFRRMEAIERDLLKGAEADAKALEDALRETGEELKRSDLAKPAGESLAKNDLDKTKKDLKDLAARLRDAKKQKPTKAELDRLRQALEKASAQRKEALAAVNEKRAELQTDLLKKKRAPESDGGAPNSPDEEKLLKKRERELERLDREAEQRERTGRQLDKLDRALGKAAEDLFRDLGLSAEDLEQAAEDINRMQQEEMSDKDKEELRQRLDELRELLRQQGQGGKQRMARMLRFGKRARGSQGQQGEGQEQGQGEKGDQDGQGEEGQGEDGQEGQQGQGQSGRKGAQGQRWVLGPGGKKILVPGPGQGQSKAGQGAGQGQGQGEGQGQGQGQGNGGEGTEPGGKGIGSGHDGNIAGKRTDPKMGTSDVQAAGLDSQQGPDNSQVILGAAERGFKGSGYKKVFTEYHTVAEQQINKDQIPDGYRFYVHRYFQLIRPRE